MKKIKLDNEEKEILEAFENDNLKRPVNSKKIKSLLVKAAKATTGKTNHISIRISEKDLMKLKAKSIESGIPYQTLIGSLIHQYAEGNIKLHV
ncbi:antitoxin [Spirochaetota bacterium]